MAHLNSILSIKINTYNLDNNTNKDIVKIDDIKYVKLKMVYEELHTFHKQYKKTDQSKVSIFFVLFVYNQLYLHTYTFIYPFYIHKCTCKCIYIGI